MKAGQTDYLEGREWFSLQRKKYFLRFSNRINSGGVYARKKKDIIVKSCFVYSNLNSKKCFLLSEHPTVLKAFAFIEVLSLSKK